MALYLMKLHKDRLCIKQKGLFIACALLALGLMGYALFIDAQRTSLELALGVLLLTINRSLLLANTPSAIAKQPE